MKDKLIIVTILFKPWILGLIPAIVIIMLLPQLSSKYVLKQIKMYDNTKDKLLTFYEDIDSNGTKEKFDILNYTTSFASCIYSHEDGSIKGQINIAGKVMSQPNKMYPIFCDINKDRVKEIFIFTQKDDSIYLNIIDLKALKRLKHKRFITKISISCKKDFDFRPLVNHDNNSDGIPEIYFEINGGYSMYPRIILAYDYVNDSLTTSFNSGSMQKATPFFNSKKEMCFFSVNRITDNWTFQCPYPYIDTLAWLFGFNDKLELFFEPKHFNGFSTVVNGPIFYRDEIQYCVLHEDDSTRTKKMNYFIAFNEKGQTIRKKELTKQIEFEEFETLVFKNKNHYILNSTENGVPRVYEYFPEKMEIRETKLTRKLKNLFCYPFQLDKNTPACIAYNPKSDEYSLFLEDFKHLVSFGNKLNIRPVSLYVQTQSIKDGTIITVTGGANLYSFLLTKNNFYYLRFLFFGLIYLFNVTLIFIPIKYQKHQARKQEKLQKEISHLQMKLVNTGLEPHFLFNALNAISSKILKGERLEAYDLLNNFSDMMRATMNFSEKDSWTLKEELKLINDYLTLMKVRFNTLFDYSMLVASDVPVETTLIPLLLVQNFVDNAIKHAFTDISYLGHIQINVTKKDKRIEIAVTDNGIGREKASRFSSDSDKKSGKGIQMNAKQVEIFNNLYSTNIRFEILDLQDNFLPVGTKIIITIPITN